MSEQHEGHRARMRGRFLKTGLDGYAPHEVLELLLSFAILRRDTNSIAHALLERFGSLHKVLEAPHEELMKTEGVGEHAAVLLKLILPAARYYLKSRAGDRARLTTPNACKAYARGLLMGERAEHFHVIALDAKRRVIAEERVSSGDEGSAAVSVRKVIAVLLRLGAAGAVLAHNHPGGGAEPSKEDVYMTRCLAGVMASVGITLADHVLIAGADAYSFKEAGLLPAVEEEQHGKKEA